MDIKAGIKSTEFWISAIAMAAGVAAAIFVDNQWVQLVGSIAAAVAPINYARGRAFIKGKATEKS